MLVNFNGHFLSGAQGIVDSTTFNNGWYNGRLENAVNYINDLGDNWAADMEQCPICGAYLRLVKKGDHYEVATRVITGEKQYSIGMLPVFETQYIPCKYPAGMKPFEVTIEVPSGKLAFFNFLKPANDPVPQDIIYSGECDINISAGRVKYTQKYAENNILYPWCGNTSVVAYKTPEGLDFRYAYEEDEEGLIPRSGLISGKSVSCSVWWFTALDLELLKKLYNTDQPETMFDRYEDFIILDIEPGTYVFTMDYSTKAGALASGRKL